MIAAVLLGSLAVVDAGFCGFRNAAGKDPRIEKRRYYRRAVRQGMGLGLLIVVASAIVIALLVRTSNLLLWPDLLVVAGRMVMVYGAYATLVVGALGVYLVATGDLRTLATVSVLGPFTLIRPMVIAGGAAFGVYGATDSASVVVASLAALAMILFETGLGRLRRPS